MHLNKASNGLSGTSELLYNMKIFTGVGNNKHLLIPFHNEKTSKIVLRGSENHF